MNLKKFWPIVGNSDRAGFVRMVGTSYRAGDNGLSTAQQKSQWESNTHADPMHDAPLTMFALLLLLALTVVMAVYEFVPAGSWEWVR